MSTENGKSEMVERVAKAIWSDYWDGEGCSWAEMEESARQTALSMARAAIEAMREPNEAMIGMGMEADHRRRPGSTRPSAADAIWRAMIDAAAAEDRSKYLTAVTSK